MIKIFASIILGFLVAGCGSYYVTLLKNPESGDIQKCQAWGSGIIGGAAAENVHDQCVEEFISYGYELVEKK